ncbi:MAG: hypothetical protein IAE78_10565 [Myxococcus sp.]|nr:hypothetical protein [Myxococcus sp.]
MRTLGVLATMLLVVGCSGYKNDVELVCNARERTRIPAGTKVDDEAELIKAHLFVNIHSPKGKKVFLSLGSMRNAEKLELLRREAAAEGISPCPLADEAEAAIKKAAQAAPPEAPPAAAAAVVPAPAAAPAP